MASKKSNKRNLAEELFMNTNYSQKEICEVLEITEQTFTRWKAEGKWAELKGATTLTANKVLQQLYIRAEQITSDKDASADDIAKIASAIDKLKPNKVTIANYINTFMDFGVWLSEKDLQAAKLLNHFQKQFIDEKLGF